MKSITFIFISFIILSCNSCTQNSKKKSIDESTDTMQSTAESTQPGAVGFDINSIPISTAEIGEYPYLAAPKGYQYANEINREYEEKYFFYNDSLMMMVGGQYYHAMILPIKGGEFTETSIVKNYEQAISKLDGVMVYTGKIISTASDLLRENSMPYAKDMYDPYPYNYKQFLIRTSEGDIWFELCYGLNIEGIDFTVVYDKKDK